MSFDLLHIEKPEEIGKIFFEYLKKRNKDFENIHTMDPVYDILDSLSVTMFHFIEALKVANDNNSIFKATQEGLDNICSFFDIQRKENEMDEFLRERVLVKIRSLSGKGTKDFFHKEVLNFSDRILDAEILNSNEYNHSQGIDKAPGLVDIYIHFNFTKEEFLLEDFFKKEGLQEDEEYYEIFKKGIENNGNTEKIKKSFLNHLNETIPIGVKYNVFLSDPIKSKIEILVSFFNEEFEKTLKLEEIKKIAINYFDSLKEKMGKGYSQDRLASEILQKIQTISNIEIKTNFEIKNGITQSQNKKVISFEKPFFIRPIYKVEVKGESIEIVEDIDVKEYVEEVGS